jgi:hypothetical protein
MKTIESDSSVAPADVKLQSSFMADVEKTLSLSLHAA